MEPGQVQTRAMACEGKCSVNDHSKSHLTLVDDITSQLMAAYSASRRPGVYLLVRDHFVHSIFNSQQQLNIELEIENSLEVACNFNIQFY